MSEFLAPTLEVIAIFSLNGILNSTGDGIIDTEHRALNQLNLPRGITTQISRRLSLTPGLGGGCFAASIGGRDTARNTKASRRVFHLAAAVLMILGLGLWMACYVGFRQAVARGGTDRRATTVVVMAMLGVVKGAAEGALVLVEE